jgi:hemoglobin
MSSKHIITEKGQVILAEDVGEEDMAVLAREFYDDIGGADFFARLALRFYTLVLSDPVLAPLFADDDAQGHAERLAAHFDRFYGIPDLSEGWSTRFVRVHTLSVFTHEHRRNWLENMRKAGCDVAAPEPWFSDLMATLTNATGVVLGISRGAAVARGIPFDRQGHRITEEPPT